MLIKNTELKLVTLKLYWCLQTQQATDLNLCHLKVKLVSNKKICDLSASTSK